MIAALNPTGALAKVQTRSSAARSSQTHRFIHRARGLAGIFCICILFWVQTCQEVLERIHKPLQDSDEHSPHRSWYLTSCARVPCAQMWGLVLILSWDVTDYLLPVLNIQHRLSKQLRLHQPVPSAHHVSSGLILRQQERRYSRFWSADSQELAQQAAPPSACVLSLLRHTNTGMFESFISLTHCWGCFIVTECVCVCGFP